MRAAAVAEVTVNCGYTARISPDGQASIPVAARKRRNAGKVLVADMGDRLVMRPRPALLRGPAMGPRTLGASCYTDASQ